MACVELGGSNLVMWIDSTTESVLKIFSHKSVIFLSNQVIVLESHFLHFPFLMRKTYVCYFLVSSRTQKES